MPRVSLLAGAITLLLTAGVARAVRPGAWVFALEKDFQKGAFHNTVVDSYGRLTLARDLHEIRTRPDGEMITALVQAGDGAIYAASNPGGKIFRIHDGQSAEIYSAPKEFSDITAMGIDSAGNLLVALSGDTARLVRFSADPSHKAAPATVFENKNVDNIWAIATARDGATYLGTGPHGAIFKIGAGAPAGEGEPLLETSAKNILALAFDHDGKLLAATDGRGLVIRLDPKTGKPFVLLDAGKVDVNALQVDPAGNIYVATAKADEEKNPDADEPETKSKPGAVEPPSIEPPAEDKKIPAGTTTQPGPGAMITLAPTFLAAPEPAIPGELKKMLARAMLERLKDGPATGKKPGLPTRKNSARGEKSELPLHLPGLDLEDQNADASAVYRIDPSGAVTTLFKQGELNYALALAGDDLLIGTGKDGKLFRYNTRDQSLALLDRRPEQYISALLTLKNGEVLLGTANAGNVYQLGAGLAPSGTFTSQVLDAGHAARWGAASLEAALPAGAKATIATRTANVDSVTGGDEKFWSEWSPEISPDAAGKIPSPAARYLQFRITLTGNAAAAPVVNRIRIGYQTENLAPAIARVHVDNGAPGDDEGQPLDRSVDVDPPTTAAQISWDASDPNGDTLLYRIFYRPVPAGNDQEVPWTPLAKDIRESVYEWDTRGLADGRYQVKVIASDSPDNPSADARETARVSAPVIIDHTPPTLGELKTSATGNKAQLSGDARDSFSSIVDVRYQIDGHGDWQPASASDKIFDSPHESFTIVTGPLSAGAHRITVRAADAQGNCSYKIAAVIVKS